MQGASLQSYDFTITAGQSLPLLVSGNYFLIKSSTGALNVRGDFGRAQALIAGQGINGREFTKLELENKSGATISGVILIEAGAKNGNGFFDLNLILSGAVVQRPEAWNGFSSVVSLLAANTAETVFTPGVNTNGAILQFVDYWDYSGGPPPSVLIAKNAAPTSLVNEAILASPVVILAGAGNFSINMQEQERNAFIPAGLGLYWFGTTATTAACRRSTRYKLL